MKVKVKDENRDLIVHPSAFILPTTMPDTPINNDHFTTPDGAIRLVCQDAADFLATLADKSVDLVVTSPPFNMLPRDTKSYGYRARRQRDNWLVKIREVGYSDNMPEWAYQQWLREMVGECLRVSRGVVCLHHKCRGQDDYLSHPLHFLADFPLWGEIIWVHGTPAQNQQRHPVSHEAIYVFGRGGKRWWNQQCARYQSVWFVSPERGFDGHPCPFPLEIPKRLIDSFTTKRGQTVVDPFAGRGTTLAAAAQLGRKALGCEISLAFFQVAKRYLSEPPVLDLETQLEFLERNGEVDADKSGILAATRPLPLEMVPLIGKVG